MTYILIDKKPPLNLLVHHGVKGMHWGVRKDRDGSTKVGSSDAGPAIALGAAYAALILASLAVKTADSGKINQIKTRKTPWKKNKVLSKKMSVDDLYDNVVKQINPTYGAKGTKMNCRRCTFTYEMRRRGYDVKATTSLYATGQDQRGLNKATSKSFAKQNESLWGHKQVLTPNAMLRSNAAQKSQAIFDEIAKNPDGSRGELGVGWGFGGGHSMAWEVVDGKPIIFDTQNSMTYRNSSSFETFSTNVYQAAVTRLDNVKIDDDFIRKWSTNA